MPDESRLSRDVASAVRDRYLQLGWWYCGSGVLLLPRRETRKGMRYPAGGPGPLAYTCAIVGDDASALEVTRVPQALDAEAGGQPPLGAHDCVVAPVVGADALGLLFQEESSGRWTYGPRLEEHLLDVDVLEAILKRADAAGARVLVVPEYCCSPALRQRWLEVLARQSDGSVRWLVIGSGPIEGADGENTATLLSRDGSLVVDQPKVQLFDLAPAQLDAWKCPDIPPTAHGRSVTERAAVKRSWGILECNGGRLAVAVCESFRPRAGSSSIEPLAAALPTLLLCPVFSQQPRETCWERDASGTWGDLGTEVVIANSLVVAQWQARATGDALDGPVACAAARPLVDGGKGHMWQIFAVDAGLVAGATIAVAHLSADPLV